MHIAFLTLFLGLTSGVQPFELSVNGTAAAVEVLLDGAVARRLSGPPWKGEVDFGPDLAPHELVARALDGEGREIARTRQWVNLPRPPAEVEIALEGRPGAPSRVRLSWERLTHDPPLQTTLTFDGQLLRLDDGQRATLPGYDRESTHVLTAELRFPSNVVARKDLIFGGVSGETYTELTAVPVRLLHMGDLPGPAALQGWFVDGHGQPLEVAAVEKGEGELYVIRVPGPEYLRRQVAPPGVVHGALELPLGKDDLIRLVSPWARSYLGAGTRTDLFDLSPHFPGYKGLAKHLAQGDFRREGSERLRPADAAAVAGLQAMAGGRRRVVVLLLDALSRDDSLYHPAAVRRYLSSIRVPLHVWSVDRDVSSMQAWGNVADAWSLARLERAFRQAAVDLDRQRIVWVKGQYLPQSIRLSPKAGGIEIAAGGAPPP
jgi:hypothetical protein